MANLTISESDVVKGTGASVAEGIAGATITAGQPLYKDAADSDKLKPADADSSTAAAHVVGIALHAALAGQPVSYIDGGQLTLGVVLIKGQLYQLSTTAGAICPASDLAAKVTIDACRATLLGIALSTSVLYVLLYASDIIMDNP